MSYEDEERRERVLFSLAYRATAAEQRAIYLKVCRTKEWIDWSAADDAIKYGTFETGSEQGIELVMHAAKSYRAMIELTAAAIDEVTNG